MRTCWTAYGAEPDNQIICRRFAHQYSPVLLGLKVEKRLWHDLQPRFTALECVRSLGLTEADATRGCAKRRAPWREKTMFLRTLSWIFAGETVSG